MIDASFLAEFFQNAAARLEDHRDELCRLDGEIGDGDHGSSMANGFAAVARLVRGTPEVASDPAALMREAASAFLGEVGATVGPLYAAAMIEAAGVFKEPRSLPLTNFPVFLSAMATGVQRRGKATLGDKTMLDAWLPAADRAAEALREGCEPAAAAWYAVAEAKKGADNTATMVASRGRAARLKERSLGHRDPGAVSAALILEAFAQTIGPVPSVRGWPNVGG